jgi:hypothetical protein
LAVPIFTNDKNSKMVSKVVDGHIKIYNGTSWEHRFLLGAIIGNRFPGNLLLSKEEFYEALTWAYELGMRVLRIPWLYSPSFYQVICS